MRMLMLALAFLVCSISLAVDPPDEVWRQRNDLGNRYEGLRPSPVANEELELLAVQVNSPFSYAAQSTIKARFFIPKGTTAPVRLFATELDVFQNYWLESKPAMTSWKANALATFEWSSAVLDAANIPAENIGVLVPLPLSSPPGAIGVAPVHLRSVSQRPTNGVKARDAALVQVQRYLIQFRANRSLGEIGWSLANTKQVAAGVLDGSHYASSRSTVVINTPAKWPDGWYTLRVHAPRSGADGEAEVQVRLFHRRVWR
jgi:hypothetical protein